MHVLEALAWLSLGAGAATTLAILADVRAHPQTMPIMGVVWPITGLYAPLFGYFVYRALGRPEAGRPAGGRAPAWRSVFLSSAHCGAGCVVGDLIGPLVVALFGLSPAGQRMFADFVVEFAFAYVFGIAFQFLPIRAMRGLSVRAALTEAIKADTLSLVAFEIGMFGWMALAGLGFGGSFAPASIVFWFLMQIGMLIGFATTYPANWILIRTGVKARM